MAVTTTDVLWCYRHILEREPESSQILEFHASAVSDFRSLVLHFINCQEFLQKKTQVPPIVPLDAPAMDVEVEATGTQLGLLRARVRDAWTHLGERRPLHSVLTAREFLPENLDEKATARFWSSGMEEAASIAAMLRKHGVEHTQGQTCVEYGCGMGRVSFGLAKMFRSVHAYDISSPHLDLAKQRALEIDAHNISFHLLSEDIAADPLEGCDFFYSRLVFQHNPPPVIRELIIGALKSLRPGGITIFQVPTYGTGYRFRINDYLAHGPKLDMEMHCIPQNEVFSLIAAARCRILEVRDEGSWWGNWISNSFVVQRPPE